MRSPAQEMAELLAPLSDPEIDHVLAQITNLEWSGLAYDWAPLWARPEQRISQGPWRSWGSLAGRRWGKTMSNAMFVNQEAESGRAMRIGFSAQNLDKAIEVQVYGDCGLIATSPPWFKARFESNRVIWPNGAQAFPFTPEVPGAIRGPGVHLMWISEMQSWPASTMDEAFHNAMLMTSLGYAKTIWDATPKRKHPLIRRLLRRAEEDPGSHKVIRGSIQDNADNLGPGVVEELIKEMGGTQRGREELEGHFFDDDDGAMWRQSWIDNHRRHAPETFVRRILAVDPAGSKRRGSDRTGIIDLGHDEGQIYVLGDHSGKYSPEQWARTVLDLYGRNRCDCVVVERNNFADYVAANLRAQAEARGVKISLLDTKARVPPHRPGVVQVKEVHASRDKVERAGPVASVYERGGVSHAIGADLTALEDTLTTWDPSQSSPDAMDALVHGVFELAHLSSTARPDPRAGFQGLAKAAAGLGGAHSTLDALAGLTRSPWGSTL